MPDHSSDTLAAVPDEGPADAPEAAPRRSRRVRRTDWRLGGRTVLHWRESLLAIALGGLGAGFVAGFFLPSTLATVCVWLGMLVAIVIAFSRSRPVGLLRFRPVDLLWAAGLGLLVRLVQGWAAAADGHPAPFPTLPTVDGHLASGWWFEGALAPVLIAPPIEEFFFRGVLLVALYTVLRRPFGGFTAGLVALLVSTGLFIAAHAVTEALTVPSIVAVGVLGLVCGLLVLLTGRIWPAVGVHVVYNALGVVLALAGR